jgi:hypothetical protein
VPSRLAFGPQRCRDQAADEQIDAPAAGQEVEQYCGERDLPKPLAARRFRGLKRPLPLPCAKIIEPLGGDAGKLRSPATGLHRSALKGTVVAS